MKARNRSTPSKKSIREAIKKFANGERPKSFRQPRAWYVVDDSSGRLLPLKGVWALATHVSAGSFNTSIPLAQLPKLGFKIVRHVNDDRKDPRKAIKKSLRDTSAARRSRISKSPKKPTFYFQPIRVFVRNPDVVAEALYQANGRCDDCRAVAPFKRRSDKSPYLEVHHVKPLSSGGLDNLENVIALCPNCHRKRHHG